MGLDAYRRRLNASSSSEALLKKSIMQVNKMYNEAINLKTVILDDETKNVRIDYYKDNERKMLLRPTETTHRGAIVEFDNSKWMVYEFQNNPVYPKAKLRLCNQDLKWNVNGIIKEYPCIVEVSTFTLDESGASIKMRDGKVKVTTPYNDDTKCIEIGQRFIFEGDTYQVISNDKVSKKDKYFKNYEEITCGLVNLQMEIVSTSSNDNLDDNIGDSDNGSGWGGADW